MSLPDSTAAPVRRRWWRIRPADLVIPLLIVVLVLGVLELIPANEYMLLPGNAMAVSPMIHVKGYPPVRSKGGLYLTDVTLYKVDHLLEELYGKLNPDAELYPAQTFSGGLSESQYLQANIVMMDDSIETAEAAALEVTRHYKPHFSKDGPEIAFTVQGTPAYKSLRQHDIIVGLNGKRVHTTTDVHTIMDRVRPGSRVRVTVRRNGKLLHLTVGTIPSTNGVPDKHGKTALLGVDVQDRLQLPVKVSISSGSIGGPSAGLMFTLGLIERFQQRDLTHGCKVAGTGTIDLNGKVGEIGGARQKIIAAKNAGAQYFLVPNVPDNAGPAEAARGNVIVKPVKTLAQALAYLKHIKPCT